jgi:hypothetical protein
MTISLAFLAPHLVQAAVDGRLPHGIGVARLLDAPVLWERQQEILGLAGDKVQPCGSGPRVIISHRNRFEYPACSGRN